MIFSILYWFIDDYVNNCLQRTLEKQLVVNEFVIIGKNQNLFCFARLLGKVADMFALEIWETLSFDENRYCYVVSNTFKRARQHYSTFLIPSSMPLYFAKNIRVPYYLPENNQQW